MKQFILGLCTMLPVFALGQGKMTTFKGAIDSVYFFHGQLMQQSGGILTGQYKYDNQKEWIELGGTINASDNIMTLYEYTVTNGTKSKHSVFKGPWGSTITGEWNKLDGDKKEMPFYFMPANDMNETTTQCYNATFFTTATDKSFPTRQGKVYTLIPDNTYSAGSVIWFDQPYRDHFTISFEYMIYDDDGVEREPSYSTADGISLILFKDKATYEGVLIPRGSDKGFIKDGTGISINFKVYEYREIVLKDGYGTAIAATSVNTYTGKKWFTVSVSVDAGLVACTLNDQKLLTGVIAKPIKDYTGFGIGAGTGGADALHRVKNVRITKR